jgi:multiple sugar transport system ATP-binding protein
MEEPVANRDAKLRAQMRTELQQLQETIDVTTIYVTHNQVEAMTMGDRVAVMRDGRIQQVGEPLELYHAPANQFIAGFIGEPMMNFIPGANADGEFEGEHLAYPLDDELREAVRDSDDLVLGVRPEDVDLRRADADADPSDDHEYEMTVTVVEPYGDSNLVYLAPGDGTRDEDVIHASTDGLFYLDEGTRVITRIDPGAIHLFDATSGEALHNRRLEPEQDHAYA